MKEGDCFCGRALLPEKIIRKKAKSMRKLWDNKVTEQYDKLRVPFMTVMNKNIKQLMIFQDPANKNMLEEIENNRKKRLNDIDSQELGDQANILCTSQLSIVNFLSIRFLMLSL